MDSIVRVVLKLVRWGLIHYASAQIKQFMMTRFLDSASNALIQTFAKLVLERVFAKRVSTITTLLITMYFGLASVQLEHTIQLLQ